MRHFLSILIILSASSGFFAQQRTLSLDEAIATALQRNTILQQNTNNIEGYRSAVKNAYGNLLPDLNASGSWNWSRSERKVGETIIVQGNPFTLPGEDVESRSYNVAASSSITLFDGLASWAYVSQTRNDLEAARQNLQRLKQDIVFGTIQRYHNTLNVRQLANVRRDDLEYNRKNLEIINERNKLGAVTLADVYAQQVRVGNAELAVIQAENEFENLRSDLLNFLGISVIEDIALIDPLENGKAEIIEGERMLTEYGDINQLIDNARNNRPDLKGAQLALESAYNNVTVSRGGYYPQISNDYRFSMGANRIEDIDQSRNYSVGISVFLPLFSGWATENSVQQAKVRAKNQELTLSELEREINISLKNTYLNLQAAKKRLEVSEQNVLSAQQNRQIEEEKYRLGSSSLVNLLLASSEYTLAQQNNINAKFDFLTLKSQLEYYLGVIDYKRFE